jgi:hypothetical protein
MAQEIRVHKTEHKIAKLFQDFASGMGIKDKYLKLRLSMQAFFGRRRKFFSVKCFSILN